MTFKRIRSPRFTIALVAALLSIVGFAQAGPPLICHTFEIGQAKSLPWISHNWNLSGSENYDTKSLVRDTLEILGPDTPVLVRMETLRRALRAQRPTRRERTSRAAPCPRHFGGVIRSSRRAGLV